MKKIILSLMVLLAGCTAVEEKKEENPIIFNMAIVSTNNINGKSNEGVGYTRLSNIIKTEENNLPRVRPTTDYFVIFHPGSE